MRFAVAGQFALDAAKAFEVFEGQLVETIICAQGVDAIFGVAGVVHEIEGLMPWPASGREHDAMNRGHDFSKRSRTTPVTSSAAINSMHVHERDQGASSARIRQAHVVSSGVLYCG